MSPEEYIRLKQLYSAERIAYSQGYVAVAGIDEVGRGSLAGPISAGACILGADADFIEFLNDSKAVSPKRRSDVAKVIQAEALSCSVAHIPPSVIDSKGLMFALRLAMSQALSGLDIPADVVYIDGNPIGLGVQEISVVKGDAKIACISAASVIAKVARDELMVEYGEQYPEYGFDSHKGYGALTHREAIKKYGLSPIHRSSFCQNIIAPTLF